MAYYEYLWHEIYTGSELQLHYAGVQAPKQQIFYFQDIQAPWVGRMVSKHIINKWNKLTTDQESPSK